MTPGKLDLSIKVVFSVVLVLVLSPHDGTRTRIVSVEYEYRVAEYE